MLDKIYESRKLKNKEKLVARILQDVLLLLLLFIVKVSKAGTTQQYCSLPLLSKKLKGSHVPRTALGSPLAVFSDASSSPLPQRSSTSGSSSVSSSSSSASYSKNDDKFCSSKRIERFLLRVEISEPPPTTTFSPMKVIPEKNIILC